MFSYTEENRRVGSQTQKLYRGYPLSRLFRQKVVRVSLGPAAKLTRSVWMERPTFLSTHSAHSSLSIFICLERFVVLFLACITQFNSLSRGLYGYLT
jgi:hypothetical protein